jgi:hypothetical protein
MKIPILHRAKVVIGKGMSVALKCVALCLLIRRSSQISLRSPCEFINVEKQCGQEIEWIFFLEILCFDGQSSKSQ